MSSYVYLIIPLYGTSFRVTDGLSRLFVSMMLDPSYNVR